jgi:hypothetical protein
LQEGALSHDGDAGLTHALAACALRSVRLSDDPDDGSRPTCARCDRSTTFTGATGVSASCRSATVRDTANSSTVST